MDDLSTEADYQIFFGSVLYVDHHERAPLF